MKTLVERLRNARIEIELVDNQLKLRGDKGSLNEGLLSEIKANKEALIQYLQNEAISDTTPITQGGENYYELSLFQQEIWLNTALYEANFYNQIRPFLLEGALDIPAFEKATKDLIDRYEILRTTFHLLEGVPYQKVESRQALFGDVIEVIFLNAEQEGLQEAVELVKNAGKAVYDLSKGPLIKFLLVRFSANRYVFAILSHHIIMDGWSSEIIASFLISRYLFYTEGSDTEFMPLPFQYKDFAASQNQKLKAGQLTAHRDFWTQYLAGEIPQLNLPTDFVRPAIKTFRGDGVFKVLDTLTAGRLNRYCNERSITPFIFFQVLVKTLLYRYTGQKDLIIGTVFAGRESVAMEKQVGSFANILPVRTKLNPEDSFRQLVQKVRQQIFEIYTHQFYPFTQIIKDLELPFDQSHSPLFDVTVIVQNFQENHSGDLSFGALKVKPLDFETTRTTQDLSFIVTEKTDGQIEVAIFYNSAIFKPQRIKALGQHLENLLHAVLTNDSLPVSTINYLSDKERFELLHTFNNTSIGAPEHDSILDLFDQIRENFSQHIALVSNDHKLSYRDLDAQSNNLAAWLQKEYKVGQGDFVGVLTGRNHYTMISLLAVMKLGAIFMPIDEDLPEQRIREMCDLTTAKLVIVSPVFFTPIRSFYAGQILVINEPILKQAPETTWTRYKVRPSDPAYIVFTSGSTGMPKPIIAKHEGLINNVTDYIPKLGVVPDDNYLQFFAVGFDGFFFDIFPLLAGATLVMIDKEIIKDKHRFLQYLDTHNITMTAMTPSYLDVLERPELPTVKALISAGEAVDTQTAMYYAARKRFFNLYGPAEATVIASFYEVIPEEIYQVIPIGKPCANKSLYVLDDHLNLVPKGVPGELCISGAGVVDGYFKAPEQSAEKFVPNPFLPGKFLYRTGDMAIWTDEGDLLFAGRKDNQVKVNGHRVEPGEVETMLLNDQHIAKAIVLANEKGDGLLAFFQKNQGSNGSVSPATLRHYLAQRIPAYMVPGRFIEISEWPVTTQGKVDHKKLLQLAATVSDDTVFAAPENQLQETILGIWKQLLKRDEIGIYDHFFQIGGDSLMAIRAISGIRKALDRELSVKDMLLHPTIESLAGFIETSDKKTVLPRLSPGSREEKTPLSYAQERIWIIDQLEGSIQYHIPTVLRWKNKLDKPALALALRDLVRRHESLRSIVLSEDGRPYQKILPADDWELSHHEGEAFELEASLNAYIESFINRPFDLSADFMFRAHLLQCADNDHVLILVIHHIASDGWSEAILVNDLTALYQARLENRQTNLPELTVQYADYAIWQRKYLSGAYLSTQLSWWEKQLSGIEPLNFPTDYVRPAIQSTRGASVVFPIDKNLLTGLKSLSAAREATLFMTLLSAFKVLLYRYSGQEDICVGTPVANRNQKELESLVGFFINTLALRSNLGGNPGFSTLLDHVKESTLEAFFHQEVPFEQIVNRVETNRSMSRSPIFQVMFVMQNMPESQELQLGGTILASQSIAQTRALFDLTFSVKEKSDELLIAIEYCRDLFAPETIHQIAGHFKVLLADIVSNPDKSISSLNLLEQEEVLELTQTFNNTSKIFDPKCGLLDLWEKQAALNPDNTAIALEGRRLSYRMVQQQSDKLAFFLRKTHQVGPNDLIGLMMERSEWAIIAILGILKSGAGYVPIDLDYPQQRKAFMVAETQLKTLIVLSGQLDEAAAYGVPVCALDLEMEQWQAPATPENAVRNPKDLAYVIFTSGSTGKPKGVMVEEASLLNYLFYSLDAYLPGEQPFSFPLFTSLAFDLTQTSIFLSLLSGGTLTIEKSNDPDIALENITQNPVVNAIKLTPSHLNFLEGKPNSEIRVAIVGGEQMEKQHVAILKAMNPDIRIYNEYGPTEATIGCTVYEISDPEQQVLIGKPIANTQIFILNDAGELAPKGVPGEIYIGGECLARGYLNRPDLTAERFIVNPHAPDTGSRIYRTGDIGRWLRDGNLEYRGRKDNQVKIRGYRIELGEIESILAAAEGVKSCALVAKPAPSGGLRLAAYVVAEPACQKNQLLEYLSDKLPDYMIPAIWEMLDELPLTDAGKIDRKALVDRSTAPLSAQTYTAPEEETEKQLAAIWKALLNVENIGVHDNFFELGGDSIISIQVVSRAKQLGYALRPRDLFQHQTISSLAKLIRQQKISSTVAEQGLLTGAAALSPIQAWFFEHAFPGMAHFNQSVLLEISRSFDEASLETVVVSLVKHHDALRFIYHKENGQWVQTYAAFEGGISVVDLTGVPSKDIGIRITETCDSTQRSLDLSTGPLFKVIYIKTPAAETHNRLFLVAHHLIMDGISWRVLLNNLETALDAVSKGLKIDFGSKGTSYRQWVDSLKKHALSSQMASQKAFWEAVCNDYQPLPVDMQVDVFPFADMVSYTVDLEEKMTRFLLQESNLAYHTEINDLLLAALAKTIHNWTGYSKIVIGMEGHGREDISAENDISSVVGWFTNLYPVSLAIEKDIPEEKLIKSVKEQLRAIPEKGMGYGVLRYLHPSGQVRSGLSKGNWDIVFNYLGQLDTLVNSENGLQIAQESEGSSRSEDYPIKEKIAINAFIANGKLTVSWNYSRKQYEQKTIEIIALQYVENLTQIIHHCLSKEVQEFTPSDRGLSGEMDYSEFEKLHAVLLEKELEGDEILKF